MEMNVLGLIPARGGSKGLKNKNIIYLSGKPLINYAIQALRNSKLVNKVVVTMDSEKIAEVALEYGAEVPFLRPPEMALGNSPVYPALVHAVKKLEELQDYKTEYIITAQPTYPLMKATQIDKAVKLAIEKKADSIITVVKLDHDCHPYNIRKILPNGTIKFWKEKEHYKYPTRQSKPEFYHFGNIVVSHYDTLINEHRLEGKKNYPMEIEQITSLDVNVKEDLILIEEISG